MAKPEVRMVKIKDLPSYKAEEEKAVVEDPPLLLQSFVANKWQFIRPSYMALSNAYAFGSEVCGGIKNGIQNWPQYFTDEKKVTTAKAVAITVGGMGGYIFGGGPIRRAAYAGLGMAFMGAFCYPLQTKDLGRSIWQFKLLPRAGPGSLTTTTDPTPSFPMRYRPSTDDEIPKCYHKVPPGPESIVKVKSK